MNVNCSLVNVSSIFKTQNKSFIKPNINSIQNGDVFVKSNNQVSFKGSDFEDSCASLKSEMTDYIMNSTDIDKNQIEKFIKKYSPTTSLGEFNRLTKINSNVVDSSAGYIQQPIEIGFLDDKLVFKAHPQKICIKDIPLDSTQNKILYAQRLVHESTHALQEDSDYEYSILNMTNEFLKNADDVDLAVNSFKTAPSLFKVVEESMLNKFHSCLPRFSYTPEPINRYQTLDKITMKKYRASMSSLIKNDIDKYLSQIGNSVDKEFLIKYVNYKAHQEKDAYINEFQVAKELNGIEGKTNYDLKVDVYDALIRATE